MRPPVVSPYGSGDREFMFKRGRPCALVLRLRFRGRRRDFAAFRMDSS